MSALATLAAVLLATQAPVDARVLAFGDACLASTPASRAGLAALAAERGWPSGQAPTPEAMAWRDFYRAGEAIVRLDQHRVTDDNDGERICVVLIGPAPVNWRKQVSALVANGAVVGAPGTYETNRYQLPPELELTVWDLPDGSRIHALIDADNSLELSVNYPTGR
jgi:hypothetical protein